MCYQGHSIEEGVDSGTAHRIDGKVPVVGFLEMSQLFVDRKDMPRHKLK